MVIVGPKDRIRTELVSLKMSDAGIAEHVFDDKGLHIFEDKDDLVFYLSGDFRWYPEYKDVQAYERVFEHFRTLYDYSIAEVPSNYKGAFVRIGEDDDDIETRYFGDNPYELASAQRTISSLYDGSSAPDIRANFSQA